MKLTIRNARADEAHLLPEVERSASELFRTVANLAWIADVEDTPAETHLQYIARETEWVAETASGCIVGFLAAERVGQELHIWELAVRADFQRQGIGGSLMARAAAFAREAQLTAMTLTTFLDLPWNAPWYARLGFEMLDEAACDEHLTLQLRREAERGLKRRCAMRRAVMNCGEVEELRSFSRSS